MQKVAYLFFCKDNANRRQYKINSFIFIVEVQGKDCLFNGQNSSKKVSLDTWQSIFRYMAIYV